MKELLLIFKFLVSPQPSWREMVDAGKPAVEHERKWFYPLMAQKPCKQEIVVAS